MTHTKNPLISIIVPVFNVELYLDDCVLSILSQTYQNLEIILVDDGSTDRSRIICDSYAKMDNRIRVIHKNNGGVSSARNAGLDVARGEFIGFVDSDDLIAPEMYETLYLNLTEDANIGITACGMAFKYADGSILDYQLENWHPNEVVSSENLPMEFAAYSKGVVSNKLFRRELIVDIRFEPGRLSEDFLFMGKVVLYMYKFHIGVKELMPRPLYFWRYRDSSLTHSSRYRAFMDQIRNWEELKFLYQQNGIMPVVIDRLNQRVVQSVLQASCEQIEDEQWRVAFKQLDIRTALQCVGKCHKLALLILTVCPALWNWKRVRQFCMKND